MTKATLFFARFVNIKSLLVLEVFVLSALEIIFHIAHFILKLLAELLSLLNFALNFKFVVIMLIKHFTVAPLHSLQLLFVGHALCVEHELVAHSFKLYAMDIVKVLVHLAAHLTVLFLKNSDVLMRSFVVVEESTNSRALFIFNDFLFQNFKLELHEVDLLLQILNILVRKVFAVSTWLNEVIDISPKGLTKLLVLTVESHINSALVATHVSMTTLSCFCLSPTIIVIVQLLLLSFVLVRITLCSLTHR